jgi:hypothetical protein
MLFVLDELKEKKDQLPEDIDPISKLEAATSKIDELLATKKKILSFKEDSSEEVQDVQDVQESFKEEKAVCTAGSCCDLGLGLVKPKGSGCTVTDVCKEPAALCSGDSSFCETMDKPDGTVCGDGKACYKGTCQISTKELRAQREKKLIAKKESKLLKKKAIHHLLKTQHKQKEKKQKEKLIKNMLKRFAVFSWMDHKADSWEADITAGDYVSGLPHAPTHQQIFDHHFAQNDNALYNTMSNIETGNTYADESSENTTDTSAYLQSGTSTTATSSLGLLLIGVALCLIVAYVVFGGKKKPQPPRTIY